MDTPDQALQRLLGQFKAAVIDMLNKTADEFDARELTDDQRRVYNDFTGSFGQKVLSLQITLTEEKK